MPKKKLTQERLKEVLIYNPDTGIFINKTNRGSQAIKGCIAGSLNMTGYVHVMIDKKMYKAHRLAWLYTYGYLPENDLDHIDRIRSNNKINNLREASRQCNLRNSKMSITNRSGIKGVGWFSPREVWRARICIDGKNKALGYYKKIGDAVKARWEAEKKYGFPSCDTTSSSYSYLKDHGLIDKDT